MTVRTLLDPTAELAPAQRARTTRPTSIEGLTIGLLDISKPMGNFFLDRLEPALRNNGADVARYTKPTFSRRAPEELYRQMAAECDFVVEALAD